MRRPTLLCSPEGPFCHGDMNTQAAANDSSLGHTQGGTGHVQRSPVAQVQLRMAVALQGLLMWRCFISPSTWKPLDVREMWDLGRVLERWAERTAFLPPVPRALRQTEAEEAPTSGLAPTHFFMESHVQPSLFFAALLWGESMGLRTPRGRPMSHANLRQGSLHKHVTQPDLRIVQIGVGVHFIVKYDVHF